MAAAIQEGLKTQTRRIVRSPIDFLGAGGRNGPEWDDPKCWGWEDPDNPGYFGVLSRDPGPDQWSIKCPYGKPGDRLLLLTTWATEAKYDDRKPTELPARCRLWSYFDGPNIPRWCGKLRPGRFAPRHLRERLPTAVIANIDVERLQKINHTGALAEGIREADWKDRPIWLRDKNMPMSVLAYSYLWDQVNGCGAWDRNDFVWVVQFQSTIKATA